MKKQVQPFLIAQDLSALSQISLGAALPIFANANIPTALAPTSLLSAQTEGFGIVETQDLTTWLPRLMNHWQAQNIQLSGALIGYLGSTALIDYFQAYLAEKKLPLVVVDPVMGDSGTLYPNITPENIAAMTTLIQQAHVITPNLTEAQFLTHHDPKEAMDVKTLKDIFKALTELTQDTTEIVITGVPDGNEILTVWQSDHHFYQLAQPKLPGHFYGSGDVFAALLASQLYIGVPFSAAVRQSVQLTYTALNQTAKSHRERRFGLQLGALLQEM